MNYDLWGRRGMRPKLWSTDVVRRSLRHGVSCRGRRHYTLVSLLGGYGKQKRGGGGLAVGEERPTRARGRLQQQETDPFRPKAGAAASASPGATAGRGHAESQTRRHCKGCPVLRCPDAGNRVPQPFTVGAWDRGLGCRRQQILHTAASATLSVTHQGRRATTGHCR